MKGQTQIWGKNVNFTKFKQENYSLKLNLKKFGPEKVFFIGLQKL